MADLAEILQIEHLVIRHLRRTFEQEFDIEDFQNFTFYLRDCHIEIEERLLFPLLQAYDWEDSIEFNSISDRILKDHKLIGKLSDNLLKWHNNGDTVHFKEKMPLYFRLLLEHNNKEEEIIFPRWLVLPKEELERAKIEAKSTIESFGKLQYFKITGLTERSYEHFFGKYV